MNTAVWVAAIGAIPLTITAVASVIAATNSKRVAKETKTNGGSTMKDDLVHLRASMHAMNGSLAVLSSSFVAHVDADAAAMATVTEKLDALAEGTTPPST